MHYVQTHPITSGPALCHSAIYRYFLYYLFLIKVTLNKIEWSWKKIIWFWKLLEKF